MVSLLSQLDGVRFCILAPHYRAAAGRFGRAVVDAERHASLLGDLQRLRGKVYRGLERIAASRVRADGRHLCRFDEPCWHLVAQDGAGRTIACIRLLRHPGGFSLTHALTGAFLARMEPPLRRLYTAALEALAGRMRRHGIEVVDTSAVVADPDFPNKVLGPVIITGIGALLSVCLDRFLALAPTHHTVRTLYRRLGGEPLTHEGRELPPFYDRVYRGDHEILVVDYTGPARQPAGTLETACALRERLLASPVVCREA
jgi:hypothetical protein